MSPPPYTHSLTRPFWLLALGSLLPPTLSTPPDSTTPPPNPPPTPAAHPRLYFSTADLPAIRANAQAPYLQSVLRQYEDALNHKLNYSAGGQLKDVEGVPGTRLQLAAALYVADHGPNATQWGEYAKSQVLARVSQILKDAGGGFGGGWFAGNERTLEQLVAAFDATAPLFSPAELADAERAFAWCAEHLMFTCPPTNLSVPGCFNVADMASRLMNPNADRLGAVGLIALTFPDQPNASRWLAHVVSEMRWMLKNGVMADGQWHEPSTRYHGRVLAAFIPLAYGDRSPLANISPRAASSHRSCCSAAPRRRHRRLRHSGAEEVRRLV